MTGPADLYRYKALLVPWAVRGLNTWGHTGTAWHDGDTFNALDSQGIQGYWLGHVRCAGYDAPEVYGLHSPAGLDARDFARSLADTGSLVYLDSLAFGPDQEDSFGRMLAAVTLPDGTDLAQRMIASGHAVAEAG